MADTIEIPQAELDKAATRVTKIRNGLICKEPFISALMLRLVTKVDPTCETMWTDGISMGYNPLFVNKLTADELKAVIIHEVFHCASKHHLRRGSRNHERWNVACDYAINWIIAQAGYSLPNGALLDDKYADKGSEEIYNLLPDQQDGKSSKPQAGEVRDYDPHNKEKSGQKPTESEVSEADNDWTMALNNAEKAAKMQGRGVNSAISRMIGDMTEARIPWREIVARFVQTEVTRSDYSWSRPNPRYLQQGFILPSLYATTYGKVAIAVDTSGSVTGDEVRVMLSEVLSLLEMYEGNGVNELTVPVIYCDTKVRGVDFLGMDDTPNPKGGGGTDYVPVFDYLREEMNEGSVDTPVALIYLTDGECDSFPSSNEVHIPVVWALTEKNRRFKPPFGETIVIKEF